MPRIRMLTSVSGEGFVWEAGQVVDLPGPEAAAWADGVRAVLVRGTTPETPETATVPERSTRRRRTTKAPTAE